MPNYSGMTHYPYDGRNRMGEIYGGLLGIRNQMRDRLGQIVENPASPFAQAAGTGLLAYSGDKQARQDTLDTVALSTGLLGDVVGPAADAHRFAHYPEERTAQNLGLAVAGALPFVPHMSAIITDIKTPQWNKMWGSPSVPVGVNPSRSELQELFSERRGGDLRALIPKGEGDAYFWPADAALHQDIGSAFKLDPRLYEHGLLTRDEF